MLNHKDCIDRPGVSSYLNQKPRLDMKSQAISILVNLSLNLPRKATASTGFLNGNVVENPALLCSLFGVLVFWQLTSNMTG